MQSEKISQPLAESMQDARGDDWLDVIVELGGPDAANAAGLSRSERIAALKETFSKQAEPVAEVIHRLGGEVTGRAWINGSISARVAKKMIPALSSESHVSRLDLPHRIAADV